MKYTVGLIGTGVMGAPMALHLRRAGYAVYAYNRSPEKAKALEKDGVVPCGTIGEAVTDADFVFTMVGYPKDVEEVYLGEGGILENAKKGAVCVESFDPTIVRWFKKHAPDILRGQLAAGADDYKNMPKAEVFALSNCLLNFIARPQFIAYQLVRRPLTVRLSELLGAMRVCWTSHDPKDQKGQDTVIFEFYRPGIYFK